MTILIKRSHNRYTFLLWCGFRQLENTGENEYNFEFLQISDMSPHGSLKTQVQYCFVLLVSVVNLINQLTGHISYYS
jgi:hypothetical protein